MDEKASMHRAMNRVRHHRSRDIVAATIRAAEFLGVTAAQPGLDIVAAQAYRPAAAQTMRRLAA